MPKTSVYSPPPAPTVQAFLAKKPAGENSDHDRVAAVHTAKNSVPTQGGVAVTIPLNLTANDHNAVDSALSDDNNEGDSGLKSGPKKSVIRLQIRDIVMPVVANSALRVFINSSKPHQDTPDDDPHLVGNVAYFCCGGLRGSHPCFVFDVTDTLKGLKLKKRFDPKKSPFHVQVLAVPIKPGAVVPAVIPGTVTLTVASR